VAGDDCIMRSFITCTLLQILLGSSNLGDRMVGTCSMHGIDKNSYNILVGIPEGKMTALKT